MQSLFYFLIQTIKNIKANLSQNKLHNLTKLLNMVKVGSQSEEGI